MKRASSMISAWSDHPDQRGVLSAKVQCVVMWPPSHSIGLSRELCVSAGRTDRVNFIIFEASSEESAHPRAGLTLCGDHDLKAVSRGDTLWVITRVGADRLVPALCGRLIATGVVPHVPGAADFDPSHSDCACRLLVDEERSERCAPFACEMIDSWDIWRQSFRGVRELTDEQGRTLGMEWDKSARSMR